MANKPAEWSPHNALTYLSRRGFRPERRCFRLRPSAYISRKTFAAMDFLKRVRGYRVEVKKTGIVTAGQSADYISRLTDG